MEQEPLNIGLQQANHLLGFKEDKRPSRLRFWLAIAASLLLGGTAVFFLLKSVVDGIRLPQTTVAWAVLKRGGELPSIAPRLWREAASRTDAPLIIGLAKDGRGLVPFVITNRWNDGFEAAKKYSGVLMAASEGEIAMDKTVDAQSASQAALAMLTHPAFASLDLKQLDPTLDFILQGPLDGNAWLTNLPLKKTDTNLPTDKDAAIDLETWPEAWPLINSQMKRVLGGTEVAERPSFISWTVASDTSRSIDLGYTQTPATSTIYSLAGALGIYDEASLDLPDGSSLIELRWPVKTLAGKWVEFDKPGLVVLGLMENNLIIDKSSKPIRASGCDQGRATAFFSSELLEKALGLPYKEKSGGIYFMEDDGYLKICY